MRSTLRRIAHWHEPDGAAHVLECRLDPSVACVGGSAGGERLEATEIDDGKTALVISVEYDFEDGACGHGEKSTPHPRDDETGLSANRPKRNGFGRR